MTKKQIEDFAKQAFAYDKAREMNKTVRIIPHEVYARFVIADDRFANVKEADDLLLAAGVAYWHRQWIMFADPVAATVVLRFHGFNVIHGEGDEYVEYLTSSPSACKNNCHIAQVLILPEALRVAGNVLSRATTLQGS